MTKTLQQRRVTIPEHRRRAQVIQTLCGILAGLGGFLVVQHFALGQGWYVAAALLGLRIASREFLLDCLKIAREWIGLLGGAKVDDRNERGG